MSEEITYLELGMFVLVTMDNSLLSWRPLLAFQYLLVEKIHEYSFTNAIY